MLMRLVLFAALVMVAVGLLQRMDSPLPWGEADRAALATSTAPAHTSPNPIGPVVLAADDLGHYHADGVVSGRTVRFMIDTGATVVAINAETARRLNIRPKSGDYIVAMRTANGTIGVAPVVLPDVRIGSANLHSVQAVVMPEGALDENLLGMSFLSRLRGFESNGRELTLKP